MYLAIPLVASFVRLCHHGLSSPRTTRCHLRQQLDANTPDLPNNTTSTDTANNANSKVCEVLVEAGERNNKLNDWLRPVQHFWCSSIWCCERGTDAVGYTDMRRAGRRSARQSPEQGKTRRAQCCRAIPECNSVVSSQKCTQRAVETSRKCSSQQTAGPVPRVCHQEQPLPA